MIRPPWAASIWASGDWLFLELPGTVGVKSHTIRIPATPEGLKAIIHSLQCRDELSQIGSKGDPTQHNLEQLVREFSGPVQRTKKKIPLNLLQSAQRILRERGMIR